MLNTKFLLIKFIISSFYSKPKQPMLRVVLIIASFYLFLQLTTINMVIYFISNINEFMFYNFFISNFLVYVLAIYFSISLVFHYYEFGILGHIPISPNQIIVSKIGSILLVPSVISALSQIPTLLLLSYKTKFIELIKLILLLPISNILTILLILFILSLINSFRHYFINKTAYLVVNITVTFLFTAALCLLVIQYLGKDLVNKLLKIDFTTFTTLKNSLSLALKQLYELVLQAPIIGEILYSFTSEGISSLFIIKLISMIIISVVLFLMIVKIIAINYFKNGSLEVSLQSNKKTKVYNVKSEWANYFQRELWVINTEAYFIMQIIIGALLCPIFSLIFLSFIHTGPIPIVMNITKSGYFEIYFAYAVLIMSCINNVSGTPFSREGKYHNLINSMPMNKRKIYFSKVAVASISSVFAVGVSFIIFMVFGYMNLVSFLMMIIVFMLVYCYNLLAPIFDMLNPSIDWENPSEAVKSNPNVLVSLLFGLPLLIIVIIAHFGLLWAGISTEWSTIIILFITFIVTICIFAWFSKFYFQIKTIN